MATLKTTPVPTGTKDERVRVALDTNLWSYLAPQGVGDGLAAAVLRLGVRMVVPPATILEAARTKEPGLRRPVLRLLGDPAFEHTRTEAALEAEEWVAVARRLRPDWMRTFPQWDKVNKLDTFWTRKVPRDAYQGAPWLDDSTETHGAVDRKMAQDTAESTKRLRAANDKLAPRLDDLWIPLGQMTGQDEVLGFEPSDEVEGWRFDNARIWWRYVIELPAKVESVGMNYALARRTPPVIDTTLADWVLPYLRSDLIRKDRASWNRFWYREVRVDEMPRNWMCWAVPLAQTDYRIGDNTGIAGDQQLSSYLLDVDFFLTADRRFALALEGVRPSAPCAFARVVEVRHDPAHQLDLVEATLRDLI